MLTEYYAHYMAIAESVDAAVELDAPTWRANPDWAATLGHSRPVLAGTDRGVGRGGRRPQGPLARRRARS